MSLNKGTIKRYCLALDLKDDTALIEEYERHHQRIWPEIRKSILDSGILKMEIYRVYNRLFMILETTPEFSFEEKARSDQNDPLVQKWEQLMWTYQQALPGAAKGEKWQLMHRICEIH